MFETYHKGDRQIRYWKPMKPGDIVDIVAPASLGTVTGLKRAIRFVKGLGLEPRVSGDIFGKDLFCAQSDEERFGQLKKALYAKDSKAIWGLRGGWGSARLLPYLAQLRPPSRSKIFIGYSDLTTLHMFFNSFWNWSTIHGSMLESLGAGSSKKSREVLDLCRLIFGEVNLLEYKGLYPLNDLARSPGVLRGDLIGGNLTLIQTCLGTPWQISLEGKILILEDVNERGYQIDRMLVHLYQSGIFEGVRAIIFGDFVGRENLNIWKYIREKFSQTLSVPMLRGLPIGHSRRQRPLPLCTPAQLELGTRRGVLKVESGGRSDI